MLKQVDMSCVPRKKFKKEVLTEEMVPFKRLIYAKNIPPMDAIQQNSTIEVLSAFMYNSRNPKHQPITVSVSSRVTSIEILSNSFVQLLPCVFNDICVIARGNTIVSLWIKGLLEESLKAFSFLKEIKSLDTCLMTLLRKEDWDYSAPITKAFMIRDINYLSSIEKVNLVLSNKLFMYLVTQCILNDDYYCIPLSGWKSQEIENERYFIDLANVFKEVYITGSGDIWKSTHLIISQPFDDIVHCLVNRTC